jgi:catalase
MQTLVPTGRANYEPNSLDLAGESPGPRPTTDGYTTYPETLEGPKVRVRSETFADHYSQARMFFRSQTPVEQMHIVSALVFELSKVTLDHIRTRVLANLGNVDTALAGQVADGLGCPLPDASPTAREPIDLDLSPSLSIVNKSKHTLTGRKVGILFTDGSPSADIAKVAAGVRAAGATPVLIAPRRLSVGTEPEAIDADGQLAGTPSVTCDAIAIVVTEAGAAALAADAVAVQFVADAFAHLKAIGHTAAASTLLDAAHVKSDEGVVDLGPDFIAAAAERYYQRDAATKPVS